MRYQPKTPFLFDPVLPYPFGCTVPFSNKSPSKRKSPKLINPLPVLPLPIRIAHLQRPTKSLISFDSASVSELTNNCIRNEDAIAKFARDPNQYVSSWIKLWRGFTNRNAKKHPMRLGQDFRQTPQLPSHTLLRLLEPQADFPQFRGLLPPR
jgi:hypothetical protein